jgi:hypothetical protein
MSCQLLLGFEQSQYRYHVTMYAEFLIDRAKIFVNRTWLNEQISGAITI